MQIRGLLVNKKGLQASIILCPIVHNIMKTNVLFQVGHPGMNEIVVSVFSGLLGSCLLSEDEKLMMEASSSLLELLILFTFS